MKASLETKPGQIVILNGTPRSGKSSIATVIQNTFEGVWMNLGVDRFKQMTPERFQPGIGLRPGGERPDLEPLVVILYRAMYDAIAAHSRLGLNVEVVLQRRQQTWGTGIDADGSVPMPVRRWQDAVHAHGLYDLEVDTSRLSPEECANAIGERLENGPPPSAFQRLALVTNGDDTQYPSLPASDTLS